MTGASLPAGRPRQPPPKFWHEAVSSYVGFAVRFARGPHRRQILDHALQRLGADKVGTMFEWRDPLPGMIFGVKHFRHPRAFIRPFLVDTELASYDGHRPAAHPLEAITRR